MGGVAIKDPITGRILGTRPQTLQERYPVGRKICSGPCGRWRLLVDFAPKGHLVASRCRCCQRTLARNPGSKPRHPPSKSEHLRNRKEQHKRWRKKLVANPEAYQAFLETQRLRGWDSRRAAGIPIRVRRRKPEPQLSVDPSLFLEWAVFVKPVYTSAEAKAINRYTLKETPGLNFSIIDAVMSRVGAQDQFAVFDSLGWPHIDREEEEVT